MYNIRFTKKNYGNEKKQEEEEITDPDQSGQKKYKIMTDERNSKRQQGTKEVSDKLKEIPVRHQSWTWGVLKVKKKFSIYIS